MYPKPCCPFFTCSWESLGNQLSVGNYVMQGRTWHHHAGVGSVQAQVDSGPGQEAALADSIGINAWWLWSLPWEAPAGSHQLRVRMVDTDGTMQSGIDAPTFPGASSGRHTINVTVARELRPAGPVSVEPHGG